MRLIDLQVGMKVKVNFKNTLFPPKQPWADSVATIADIDTTHSIRDCIKIVEDGGANWWRAGNFTEIVEEPEMPALSTPFSLSEFLK